ncbi:hypothetical protein RugamoR64_15850 [Duganella rhizosphaerae]|uniref:class I SAM-dependent methyltransferase n=1 Tax=Duganella rhizosphaerae TaxID=2885763 RepID=UPI0030E94AE3
MDWTAGYASDVEYIAGFYKEQSPQWLNMVCVLNGLEPVSLDAGFTYFELGFGRGLTANLLAAAHPQGQFFATDFNPAHVAGARALAADGGIGNLTLLESSFAELAQGAVQLPQLDFITLHGIYTWVTPENQQHIVDFIARYLKPGGLVYLSYNALPGWIAALPMQRLLVEYGDAHPNRSDIQLRGAATFLQKLSEAGASYFHAHPSNQARVDGLKTSNTNYLVHEYMHKHWQPLYHADVARALGGAKMDFAGGAEFSCAYTQLFLNEERKALLAQMPDPAMHETLKDYFLNTAFRKDVFVRGARKMSPARRTAWLAQTCVALMVARDKVTFDMVLTVGAVSGAPAVYGPLCDALAVRPHTLAELAALPQLQGSSLEDVLQTAALLTTSGQAALYRGAPVDAAPARRFNQAIAAHLEHGDDYSVMCSPVLGGGVAVSYVERLVFGLLAQGGDEADIDKLVVDAWCIMSRLSRRMVRDGVTLENEQQNLQELRLAIERIVRDTLPDWRSLGMI